MGLFDALFSKQVDKFIEKNKGALLTAMQKVNEGGGIEDVDTIADDYFYLLKAVYRGGKPGNVTIDNEDYYVVVVDGISYDFDELIRHNDQRNTGLKMEIEALFSDDVPHEEVQKRLNKKIEEEW